MNGYSFYPYRTIVKDNNVLDDIPIGYNQVVSFLIAKIKKLVSKISPHNKKIREQKRADRKAARKARREKN